MNALSCHGQKLALNRGKNDNKLYILALSTDEAGSEAVFTLGDEKATLNVPYYGGLLVSTSWRDRPSRWAARSSICCTNAPFCASQRSSSASLAASVFPAA